MLKKPKAKSEDLERAQRIVENIRQGRPPKYDTETHPAQLILLFLEGKDVEAFCFAAEIHRDQFFTWVHKHAEFGEAYKHAKEHAKLWWSEKARAGLHDPSFNNTLWSMIMRNRFRHAEHRPIEVKGIEYATSLKEKQMIIEKAIGDGRLTGSEINYVTNYLNSCLKIEEMETLSKRLDALEKLQCENG